MNAEKIEFAENQPFQIKVQSIRRYPIHWHDGVTEIILPIRGDVELVANFEYITVREGDFHFVNSRSIHSIRSTSKSVVVLIHVNLSLYEQQFDHIKYMFFRSNPFIDDKRQLGNDLHNFKIDYKVRFRNLLIDILLRKSTYELSGKILEDLGNRLVYSMIFEFNWLKFIKSNESMMNPEQFDRYHRIVRYIDQHYSDRITLDDIVSSEFVTKTYFSHYWKKLSTYSFTERVNYERALKSEFLLLTNMNIMKISEQCGFSDVKYYYQNFKRWYGCMPLEHRSRCFKYNMLGADFEEMELIYFNRELDEYADRYITIECNLNDGLTDSSYIDNYMKMRVLSKPANLPTAAVKYVILNPFQPKHFRLEESDTMIFNWHNIDLSVNITMDVGYLLYIDFKIDNIEERLVYSAVDQFLDSCINRYGMQLMKRWHYFIHYTNLLSFDKINTIEELILSKVKNAQIAHTFEF